MHSYEQIGKEKSGDGDGQWQHQKYQDRGRRVHRMWLPVAFFVVRMVTSITTPNTHNAYCNQ